MTPRLTGWRRTTRTWPLFDAAVALVLTVLVQLQLWTSAEVHPARTATAAALFLVTVPLAWRRLAPLATATAVMTGVAIESLLPGESFQGPGHLGAILLALYSVAAYTDRARALLGAAAGAAGIAIHDATLDGRTGSWNAAFFWLVAAVTWLVGRSVRRHREATALAEEMALLERDREERARAAVADERARIAREMHDIVSHNVSVMVVQAEAAEEMLQKQPERAGEPVRRIQRTGREALAEMRRMLGVLRDDPGDALAPQPNLANLDALVEQVRAGGIDFDLRVEGDRRPLPSGVELTAYRVVQEALTNVIRHAGDTRVDVVVHYDPEHVGIEVVDFGRGDGGGGEGGHGLAGMHERVRVYGGAFEAGPGPEGGFRVRATIPVG
jgi:signal transduction histidine kinase